MNHQNNNSRLSPDYVKSTAEFGEAATNTQVSEMLMLRGSFRSFGDNTKAVTNTKYKQREMNSSDLTFDQIRNG